MAQQLDSPKTESELRSLLDNLYSSTKSAVESGKQPSFHGLMEVICSEAVILTAIHNIKSNRGSKTPGTDGLVMQADILEKEYDQTIDSIRENILNHKPKPIKRVMIPKPGKSEHRPLGIPSITDRIVQECVRIVIEPILEAQFFQHSYGFRPLRDASMAIQRLEDVVHKTGYHWVIEGDIKKFFDNVDHNYLLKKLWRMGIHDRRVLMSIKAMLRAGVMGETKQNLLGTPQGGIISPLLANVYLDSFDKWVTREWECKKTRHQYSRHDGMLWNLKKRSRLKPVYLVRYADDWVLVTNSRANAEKLRYRISEYLRVTLKLELSQEKTVITNLRKKCVKFLGFEYKVVKGKAKKGFHPRIHADRGKVKAKVGAIRQKMRKEFRSLWTDKHGDSHRHLRETLVQKINLINTQIRGVIKYYSIATRVHKDLEKYAQSLRKSAYSCLRKHGVKWIRAKDTRNLPSIHSEYNYLIPSVKYREMWIGVTDLAFSKFVKPVGKHPNETPYSVEGRALYYKRKNKVPLLARSDNMLEEHKARLAFLSTVYNRNSKSRAKYNLEYFMNRAYALNRDKGRCRVCGGSVQSSDLHIHHIRPFLPLNQVNKVINLATVHESCHAMIHSKLEFKLDAKIWKKILSFRAKLSPV